MPAYNFEQITVSNSAIGPTSTKINRQDRRGATRAVFRNETADIRWRDDGTNPTASVGYLLKAGEELKYGFDGEGTIEAIKFIRVSADSTLDCAYYA